MIARTSIVSLTRGNAGAQAADAAHEERDRHAGLRRAVERLDDVGVDERVHLRDDARRPPCARVVGLALDEPEDRLVQPERRDDRACSTSAARCSR